MKALKYTLILAILGLGSQLFANNEKLVASMNKQQKLAEEEIVDLWSNNNRGKDLEAVLSDYVVREVRLRSITGTRQTGSLLSDIVKGGNESFDSPQQLAQALVLEDLRRKGIEKSPHFFVRGRYLIKGADVEIKPSKIELKGNGKG